MSPRLVFRWIVFLLAAFYAVRMVLFGGYDSFGGPFRFLTIWALFASFFCASRMIALEEGRSDRRWDGLVSATAVLNGMVVYLYWSLFLNDPTSVTLDGTPSAWWLDWYLHGLGPLLQWIDALFVHRAFRRPLAGAAWVAGIVGAWLCWIELVVRPMNDSPAGDVTSGLPYPFLNDLALSDRLPFYATNIAAGLVLLAVLTGLARVIRRLLPRPEAP